MPDINTVSLDADGLNNQAIGDFCSGEEAKTAAMRLLGPLETTTLADYGCRLSIATVCAVSGISEQDIHGVTRAVAKVAFARQIAMYLAHTKFGISFTEAGAQFGRDRSTVAHACRLVEDRRDDVGFDEQLGRMEYLVDTAMRGSMAVHRFLSSQNTGNVANE